MAQVLKVQGSGGDGALALWGPVLRSPSTLPASIAIPGPDWLVNSAALTHDSPASETLLVTPPICSIPAF